MLHRLPSFLLALALVALAGCQTGESGATSRFGTVYDTLPGTTEEVTNAAYHALDAMDLTIIENQATGLDGVVVGLTARQTRVTVNVDRVDDATSRVAIRVGTLGDEPMSITILERIKRRLGATR
jgi:hypothetical protein